MIVNELNLNRKIVQEIFPQQVSMQKNEFQRNSLFVNGFFDKRKSPRSTTAILLI